MVVFIAAGGTGGHIFPGIALYRKFLDKGDLPIFVGAARDRRFPMIRKLGQHHIGLPVRPLYRRKLHLNILTLFGLYRSVRRSFQLIRAMQPAVCVGMGGFASAPMIIACLLKKIPVVLCEQNGYPGVVTRRLARFVDGLILNFPEAAEHLPRKSGSRQIVLGNPVRPGFASVDRQQARSWFGLRDSDTVLAVTGGSQGAAGINQAVAAVLPRLKDVKVLWSAGAGNCQTVEKLIKKNRNVQLFPFVDRMDYFLGAADLVVSRAGATSLAEIAAVGVASLLVPYPWAAGDHQKANAVAFAAAGAAETVLEDEQLNERIADVLPRLLKDRSALADMSRAAKKLYREDTPERMVAAVIKFSSKNKDKE